MPAAVLLIAALFALAGAGSAFAQSVTYRCVDTHGRSTYTNVREEMTGKKCTVVSREVSVVPAQQPSRSSDAKVDGGTQRARDETRRKILQEELDAAQKRLAEARQKLSQPGGSPANATSYRDEIERQEQNIASLKREIGNLR